MTACCLATRDEFHYATITQARTDILFQNTSRQHRSLERLDKLVPPKAGACLRVYWELLFCMASFEAPWVRPSCWPSLLPFPVSTAHWLSANGPCTAAGVQPGEGRLGGAGRPGRHADVWPGGAAPVRHPGRGHHHHRCVGMCGLRPSADAGDCLLLGAASLHCNLMGVSAQRMAAYTACAGRSAP